MNCFSCKLTEASMVLGGLHKKALIKFIKKSIKLNREYMRVAPITTPKYHKLQYQLAQAELLLLYLKGIKTFVFASMLMV